MKLLKSILKEGGQESKICLPHLCNAVVWLSVADELIEDWLHPTFGNLDEWMEMGGRG